MGRPLAAWTAEAPHCTANNAGFGVMKTATQTRRGTKVRCRAPPPIRCIHRPALSSEFVFCILALVVSRARKVREHTRSSRSMFKMVYHQFSAVQFPSHQSVLNLCLRSIQFVLFMSRTLPALAQIDLAGLVRLRLGSVHPVSNCLEGAEEQF